MGQVTDRIPWWLTMIGIWAVIILVIAGLGFGTGVLVHWLIGVL